MISSNIYREEDRPAYRHGNSVLLAFDVVSMFWVLLVKAYYMWRNKQRQRKWDAMSEDEKSQYLEEHQNETGPSRLDFRLVS